MITKQLMLEQLNEGPKNAATIKALQEKVGILLEQENMCGNKELEGTTISYVIKIQIFFRLVLAKERKNNCIK